MIKSVIQFFILGLTLTSAFFLIKGILYSTPDFIAELSKTKFSYNLQVVKSLSEQKGDALVGFSFLILSIILQIIVSIMPVKLEDFEPKPLLLISGVIITTFIFLIVGLIWSKKISSGVEENTIKVLKDH